MACKNEVRHLMSTVAKIGGMSVLTDDKIKDDIILLKQEIVENITLFEKSGQWQPIKSRIDGADNAYKKVQKIVAEKLELDETKLTPVIYSVIVGSMIDKKTRNKDKYSNEIAMNDERLKQYLIGRALSKNADEIIAIYKDAVDGKDIQDRVTVKDNLIINSLLNEQHFVSELRKQKSILRVISLPFEKNKRTNNKIYDSFQFDVNSHLDAVYISDDVLSLLSKRANGSNYTHSEFVNELKKKNISAQEFKMIVSYSQRLSDKNSKSQIRKNWLLKQMPGLECVSCHTKAMKTVLFYDKKNLQAQILIPKKLNKREINVIMTIDHIMPSSKGGLDVPQNWQPMCNVCNVIKSDKIIE